MLCSGLTESEGAKCHKLPKSDEICTYLIFLSSVINKFLTNETAEQKMTG
jgi:hypothetical protein